MAVTITAPSFWRSRSARIVGIFVGLPLVALIRPGWRIFDWGNG